MVLDLSNEERVALDRILSTVEWVRGLQLEALAQGSPWTLVPVDDLNIEAVKAQMDTIVDIRDRLWGAQ